jgi:hypothetical protein
LRGRLLSGLETAACSIGAERPGDGRASAIKHLVLDQALKAVSEFIDECSNVHRRNLRRTQSGQQRRKRCRTCGCVPDVRQDHRILSREVIES